MIRRVFRNQDGTAVIETAFALPILIALIWMIVQLGLVLRASAGIQHALGEGARKATLFPQPSQTEIEDAMSDAVYGVGPGKFDFTVPASSTSLDGGQYMDLEVTYTQHTSLLVFPGPTVTITRDKRVWVAS
jgi:hypothetical protein